MLMQIYLKRRKPLKKLRSKSGKSSSKRNSILSRPYGRRRTRMKMTQMNTIQRKRTMKKAKRMLRSSSVSLISSNKLEKIQMMRRRKSQVTTVMITMMMTIQMMMINELTRPLLEMIIAQISYP